MSALCDVEFDDDGIRILPQGFHQALALTRSVYIPFSTIVSVEARPQHVRDEWKSWTLSEFRVGSWAPGFYRAGRFRPFSQRSGRPRSWWLVRHPENAVEMKLKGHTYDVVIFEPGDPDGVAARIREAIGGGIAA